MLDQSQKDVIEGIIDRTSLREVLEGIADICGEKSAHIRENWQDRVTAQPWATVSGKLSQFVDRNIKIGNVLLDRYPK